MHKRRLRLTVLTTLAFAGAVSAAEAATHPIITDPAGDARALGRNQPLADLLSADISRGGADLVVTQRLAALPAANATTRSSYEVRFGIPGPAGSSGVSMIDPGNVDVAPKAELYNFFTDGSGDVIAVGTLTIDRGARTVTARYPLSDVNAYLGLIGGPPITTGTVLRRPTAGASLTQTFLAINNATDSASATGDFVFGS